VSFTAATYNILADAYIKRDWYQYTHDDVLQPARRRAALCAHLVELDVDLLCLQEVEADAFNDFQRCLEPLGYRGVFAQKGRAKPDGCATFYRTDVFNLEQAVRVEYADAEQIAERSGHIAQILTLNHRDQRLGLVNTHLKWDRRGVPAEQRYSYRQIVQLSGERKRHVPDCQAWIVCGDFNATPDDQIISHLQQTGMTYSHADKAAAYTANMSGTPKVIDYLFHSRELEASPFALPKVTPTTPLPSPEQPSDHLAVAARFSWVSR